MILFRSRKRISSSSITSFFACLVPLDLRVPSTSRFGMTCLFPCLLRLTRSIRVRIVIFQFRFRLHNLSTLCNLLPPAYNTGALICASPSSATASRSLQKYRSSPFRVSTSDVAKEGIENSGVSCQSAPGFRPLGAHSPPSASCFPRRVSGRDPSAPRSVCPGSGFEIKGPVHEGSHSFSLRRMLSAPSQRVAPRPAASKQKARQISAYPWEGEA